MLQHSKHRRSWDGRWRVALAAGTLVAGCAPQAPILPRPDTVPNPLRTGQALRYDEWAYGECDHRAHQGYELSVDAARACLTVREIVQAPAGQTPTYATQRFRIVSDSSSRVLVLDPVGPTSRAAECRGEDRHGNVLWEQTFRGCSSNDGVIQGGSRAVWLVRVGPNDDQYVKEWLLEAGTPGDGG